MFLARDWCKAQGLPAPLALTVDHGLRPDSAKEAATVAKWAKTARVPHNGLTWAGDKPAQNLQAAAREARYRLIGDHMRANGITILLTGHTLDDQAETFLLRLARGSGLDGLAGMAPVAPYPLAQYSELTLARPLLGFPHARLTATLKAMDHDWIADPSNENDRFARVQLRNLMPSLAAAGLTPQRLAAAAANLRRAREAVDDAVAHLIAASAELSPCGYALVDAARFSAAPAEVALRALARLIEALGGGEYPPRFEQTETALAWVTGAQGPRGRTFGGCRLERRAGGRILVAREEASLARETPPQAIAPGETVLWDRRFMVTLVATQGASELRHLGPEGVKALGEGARLPPVEPHLIAATTPGLWRRGRLLAAPALGFCRPEVGVSARFVGLDRP
jgi:tRNA(Ile)-lysidine synthase